MASLTTPAGTPGWPAPAFDLPGIDGQRHSPASARGPHGLVVMFICNHCPYVKAVLEKVVRDTDALRAEGVGSIAVMSNDTVDYPEDSFANMQVVAARHHFGFPYVIDATQEVGRAYGAVCTPDFFGFDRDLKLAYRGRLDASGRAGASAARRELFEAMVTVARGGAVPVQQHPSIGCSIKWRATGAAP
jgi:peroxiredoxin